MKKGQITFFIILAIVLLIIIISLIFLTKSVLMKKIEQETKISEETKLNIQPIKNFVDACLEKVSKEALILMGKQGGYIYKSQGGTLIDYDKRDEGIDFIYYPANQYKVSYLIYPPRLASGPTYFSEAPKYPWTHFPYSSDTSTEESFTGYFGVSNLAPLTRSFGPHSMREQLKTYIESNFEKCADFSAFEKQGLEINKGKPVVDVDMAENDVNFKLTYPLEIENPITKERTALRDFFSKRNIRLKKIHFFIQDMILKDISDVKFDIASKKNFRDSLSVEVIRDFYNKDDIIIVKDEKSLIDTKPFEFVFARHN